jgi:hypothetical protein
MGRKLNHLAIILLTAASVGTGQRAAALGAAGPGSRVRVTTGNERFVGRLAEVRDETVVVKRPRGKGTEMVEIRKLDIRRLEVSGGPGRRGRGAKIGALVGVGAAIAIGVAAGEDCTTVPGPASWENFTEKLNSNLCMGHTATGALSAVLTVPLGALVGYAVAPGEKWRSAGVPDLAVQPTVSRGGAGVRVTLRF